MDHFYDNDHTVSRLFHLNAYQPSSFELHLGRFLLSVILLLTSLAVLDSYCHDLGSIFPSSALMLSKKLKLQVNVHS